jgi:hypothetical protein
MVETRIALRHRVVKAGTIEFGSSSINCMVRNLPTTGAALEVSNQIGIPPKFTLVVPQDGLYLPCNVVRRSGYRIGVAFD